MKFALPLLALVALPAQAQLCQGAAVRIEPDGRVLGHLPYGESAPDTLVEVPASYAVKSCRVRAEVLPDLMRLIDAARGDPATMGQVLAVSCHRSVAWQEQVFCRELRSGNSADRAISVAPTGHSEHATGYAIDFALRPSENCPDVETCMASKPQYRWLVANARRFGFEQSFPISNKQNVKWEPWHWRWVGVTISAPGAARARSLFARARTDFPADRAIIAPPPVVRTVAPPAPPPIDKKKRKKRR